MWYENLADGKSWSTLWSDYILCGHCKGIRASTGPCAACGAPPYSAEPQRFRGDAGREHWIQPAFMGAEGRYEDWVYLGMIEREWKRPVSHEDYYPGFQAGLSPSPRASVVILFWSYFETRIERLLRAGLSEVPPRVLEDMFRRYSGIGARLNDLYRIAFDSTYKKDLEDIGHADVWNHLRTVQERRNRFAHGQPQAIDDALVRAVVDHLKVEHESWIAVFNKRAAPCP